MARCPIGTMAGRDRARRVSRSMWKVSRAKNPNGISSFSPALPDAIGLRWVANQNDLNPEWVESLRAKR